MLDRKTVRRFLPDFISDNDIKEIISTATHACNSGNEQLWQFLIIRNDEIKKRIAEAVRVKAAQLIDEVVKIKGGDKPTYAPQEFFLEAPVVIAVIAAGKYRTKPDLLMLEAGYSGTEVDDLRCRGDLQTMGAVIQLILLAAWEKGFGGCWMTGPLFARKELEELLGITDGNSLAAIIPIGKPAVVPAGRGRKAVEEVIRFI